MSTPASQAPLWPSFEATSEDPGSSANAGGHSSRGNRLPTLALSLLMRNPDMPARELIHRAIAEHPHEGYDGALSQAQGFDSDLLCEALSDIGTEYGFVEVFAAQPLLDVFNKHLPAALALRAKGEHRAV